MTTATIAPPRYLSPVPDGTDISVAEVGADLQRLPMTEQGRTVAEVLEAKNESGRPLYPAVSIQMPRRSTKTTTVQNVLLGRCATIPGYRVKSTAQDGTRSSEFMTELILLIEQHALELAEEQHVEAEEQHVAAVSAHDQAMAEWEANRVGRRPTAPKPPTEPNVRDGLKLLGIAQIYHSQQREFILWTNGSKWSSVIPEPGKLRGGAADVIWIDEAGEITPELSAELKAGVKPMMDTRPNGQWIVTGTPGPQRSGLFWEDLTKGRESPDRQGIVDWSADEWEDVDDEAVWWNRHPGLASGLTSIEILRERREDFGPEKFGMEYLCLWPVHATTTALDLQAWKHTARNPKLDPPEGVTWALGYDVDMSGTAAAVAAAWLDEDENPHVQILRHRGGTPGWLDKYLLDGLVAHPRVRVGYDSIGENIAVADALRRRPRLRAEQIQSLNLKQVGAGTALIARGLKSLTLMHAEHPGLDGEVETVTWRESGGTRLFRRNGQPIVCLLAAVHALSLVSTLPTTGPKRGRIAQRSV